MKVFTFCLTILLLWTVTVFAENMEPYICIKDDAICIPQNYSKDHLPNDGPTTISLGIDIKDIPKIDDNDFSITLSVYWSLQWIDSRLIIDEVKFIDILGKNFWIPVEKSFVQKLWLPDLEILNLKDFKTQDVISKLEGLWITADYEICYGMSSRITFICPMSFEKFPFDVHVCLFRVNSETCAMCIYLHV